MDETQVERRRPTSERAGYQIFVLSISLAALICLLLQAIMHWDKHAKHIFDVADNVLCGMFFIDFLICLKNAPDRRSYLLHWGWLDLGSCIPMIEVTRWGRMARVFRIFRVLRALRSGRILARLILARKSENTFFAAFLTALLLIFTASISIVYFETEPESNIKSADDAVWWAITTITTVGYGDCFPVTIEGRLIACILMFAGVGLFGVFSGCVASWFLESDIQEEDDKIDELKAEIVALRKLIEERQPQR